MASQVGMLSAMSHSFSGTILLDGFCLNGFSDNGFSTAEEATAILKKQPKSHLFEEFRSQPWEQVIKVFREMGHAEDAEFVAMAKQEQMRRAGKVSWPWLHWAYGWFAGYGYRPLRTISAMLVVWLVGGCFYSIEDYKGKIGPTSPIITANKDIADICGLPSGLRETTWTICAAIPQEYTTFNPWIYSADLILPLVNLQQEADWSPIVMKDDGKTVIWGAAITRWFMWFEILFGWVASLLLVTVLGNLVKKD